MYTVYMRCYEDFLIFRVPFFDDQVKLILNKLDHGYREVWWVTKNAEDILIPEYGYDNFEKWIRGKYDDLSWDDSIIKEDLNLMVKLMKLNMQKS